MLTQAQLTTLKNDIIADSSLNILPNDGGGNTQIADIYNTIVSPAFIVWKNRVSITEIGDNIVGTELSGLSTLNATRLQTVVILSVDGVNPALADRRAFFDDIFSGAGGVQTRTKLLALWKRSAKRIEKLFASGVGSDASPATLIFEGFITYSDVEAARNL